MEATESTRPVRTGRPPSGARHRGTPAPGHETAAGVLATRVPVARPGERAGDVSRGLQGSTFDSVDGVYLVDGSGRFRGMARLRDVLGAPADRVLDTLCVEPSPVAHPETSQERVASLAVHHEVASVPVVDADGRFLGAVPAEAVLRVLRKEHVEDLHRMAGILREGAHARRALEEPVARRVRDRLPWLLVGLLGSVAATWVASRYEHVLEARVAVSFFVPGIVYLADAIGTQTEAVLVRGMSLSHLPAARILGRELRTGVLIGLLLGAAAFVAVTLGFGDVRLACAVGLAVVVAGGVATGVGFLLPWLCVRAGTDPALGSGPVATVIQDVLSLLVYFAISSALLAG